MEQKKYDWLLKMTRFDSNGNRVISHVNLYDMTREQVIQIASEYIDSFTAVRVYKLEDILS